MDDVQEIVQSAVGVVVTSTILEVIISPVIYMIWKNRSIKEVPVSRKEE